jgi:hypothetical protein
MVLKRQARIVGTAARRLSWALVLGLVPLLGACASPSAAQTRELLDESSGSTLLIVQRPIVFARARTDVAANARDYATVVAMHEDRSGKYSTWLIVHRWSTVDPRFAGATGAGSGQLRIIADDRELTFNAAVPEPAFLQRRSGMFEPSTRGALSSAYSVDSPTLHYIASAQTLSLRYSDDPLPIPYTVWEDGRAALQAWLSDTRTP